LAEQDAEILVARLADVVRETAVHMQLVDWSESARETASELAGMLHELADQTGPFDCRQPVSDDLRESVREAEDGLRKSVRAMAERLIGSVRRMADPRDLAEACIEDVACRIQRGLALAEADADAIQSGFPDLLRALAVDLDLVPWLAEEEAQAKVARNLRIQARAIEQSDRALLGTDDFVDSMIKTLFTVAEPIADELDEIDEILAELDNEGDSDGD